MGGTPITEIINESESEAMEQWNNESEEAILDQIPAVHPVLDALGNEDLIKPIFHKIQDNDLLAAIIMWLDASPSSSSGPNVHPRYRL